MFRTRHTGGNRLFHNRGGAGMRGLTTIGAVMLLATACNAADSSASTAGLTPQQLVDRATAGQTIRLPAGARGNLTISGKVFTKPVVIDMSQSNLTAIAVRRSKNVRLINGRVTGTGERNTFGIIIQDSQKIEVSNVIVSKAAAGIGMQRSQDILIQGNTLTDLIADGIMVAGSQRVKVYRNSCSNFNPMPKVYDERGTLLKDGDHPDCIQGWSLAGYARTSDLEVVGNRGIGNFQGVFLNNVISQTEGGFDRVVVSDNQMQIGWYHGVLLQDAHNALVTRNAISGTGARDVRGLVFDRPIRPFITISRGTNVKACGNTVADFPTGEGTKPC